MITPKELEALERLKNTLLAEGYHQDVLQDINLIETALNHYYSLLKEDAETTKKLKALEIIKRHPFAFASLAMFLKDFNTYDEWEKVNPNCFTKEEFYLLKEELE